MTVPLSHEWVVAPFRSDRDVVSRFQAAEWYAADAHRNFRGVYTAAAGIIRQLIADARVRAPRLLSQYQLTLLTVYPESKQFIPISSEVAEWLKISREGNPRSWTRRLAHGLTDFLLAYAALRPAVPLALSFEDVDRADPIDQEFISVLVRRADPGRLLLRVGSSSGQVGESLNAALETYSRKTAVEPTEPATDVPEAWRAWLKQVAAGWAGEWAALHDISGFVDLSATPPPTSDWPAFLSDTVQRLPSADRLRLAADYVESDCTSDRPLLERAYAAVSAEERKSLHRARAAALEASNEAGLALGAIPLHYERACAGVEPLTSAAKGCMHLGFYDAALDWAERGRKLIASMPRGKPYNDLTRHMLFALLLLGRFEAVDALCDENLAQSGDPALLAHTTYARAILTARLYDAARRDYPAARGWVEKSLAYTEMLPPSEARAVNLAFLRNTLALVEMRMGRTETARELLTSALAYIAAEAPGKYSQECVLLLHNRARLQTALGQSSGAAADLAELLRHQPGDSEAHLDRGLLFQRSGKYEAALNEYNAAIRWSPPYPEPFFNRGQTLTALGRADEALADYDYVLALEPGHVEALNDRACLYYHRGELGAAGVDIDAGLRASPRHARLLCLRGLCELKEGNPAAAHASFTEAIQADSGLADAWANRATAQFKQANLEGALLDLNRALDLRGDASAFYNRGRIYEAQKRWADAATDYSQALRIAKGDTRHLEKRLRTCQVRATQKGKF